MPISLISHSALATESFASELMTYGEHTRLSEIYDDDPSVGQLLTNAIIEFEYPNYAHMTVGEIIRKIKYAHELFISHTEPAPLAQEKDCALLPFVARSRARP